MTLASLSLVLTNSTQVASPIEKQISINDFLQENETYLHVPKFNYFNDLSSLSTQNNHVETTNEVTSEFSETSEIYEEISEITSQISEITTQISEETSEISDDDDRKYSSTTSLQDSDYQNYLFKDDDDPHVDYTYYDFLNISGRIFTETKKYFF